MAPITGTYSLAKLSDLVPVVADKPLGDASLNVKLASGEITSEAHIGGALPVDFTFHVGGDFTVVALNGKSGSDDSGVVAAADEDTAAGSFAPLLRFGGGNGWLKYVATADVKAAVGADTGFGSFVGDAGAQVVMADYHRHALADGLLTTVPVDLAGLRSAMVLNHVQNLPDGDALVFQTQGTLHCAVAIEWSDVFTSEISGLARLLKSAVPIAITTTAGATCNVDVSVDDSFVVAFARRNGTLGVAVRKADTRKIDATGGASIGVSIVDPQAVESLLDDVVAGLLGTATDRLNALIAHLPGGALATDEQALAAAIIDRLKLAGTSEIAKAVDALKEKAHDQIAAIVESKVEASFAYEYHRVSSDTSVFEADIPGTISEALHRELVGGRIDGAFARPASEIRVSKFMNEKTTTVNRAWGFTLGLNKWKLFGTDRRAATLVERTDRVAKTVSRSYVGSGGYERNRLSWTVDFAADMPHASLAPTVGDYSFGLHLAVVRDEQPFTAADLDAALDFAALWGIAPESAAATVRQQLASTVNKKAEWSFHLRVNDEAWRVMCRMFGSMTPRDFAGAAAAALDPAAVSSTQKRRQLYESLWRAVLADAGTCNGETARLSAALISDAALVGRERMAASAGAGFDFATVAGTVRADDRWFDDCASFMRGCRQLATALALPTPDRGQVGDVYRLMVGFWTQTHYVRTLGAALVDCARAAGEFNGLERTLNLTSGGKTIVISSNQF